jgi:hypothetical protein
MPYFQRAFSAVFSTSAAHQPSILTFRSGAQPAKTQPGMSEALDYDGAWKEAIELYLQPFTQLCFPEAASNIDWRAAVEFLDTELQEVVRDSNLGKQRVDKLVKVRRLDGQAEWVLVLVEVQAQPDENLPGRVYQYHRRIVDRFRHRVATLVVLADARPGWRPAMFEEELWGCRTRFEYPVCKLLELGPQLDRLEEAGNPIALVMAAHLATQSTPGDMEKRKIRKRELVRRLYESYSKRDILELYRLIDWLMVLPEALEIEFRQELKRYEGDKAMPHVTSIERLARKEGREEGIAEGQREGAARLMVRQTQKRFPGFASGDEEAIRGLSMSQLEDLSEALLDFTGIEDVRHWLSHAGPTAR